MFRQALLGLVGVVLLAGCTVLEGGSQSAVAAALAEADRSVEDRARDAGRKPVAVLEFAGVQPGMTVLDIIAASGWYTEVLAAAVGPDGMVYAQNPEVVLTMFDGANDKALKTRFADNRLPNVVRLDREFTDLGLAPSSLDMAFTALNFHDVYNQDPQQAAGMLQLIRALLKPGGTLIIIDHHGNAGADNTGLHRMQARDAIAAGEAAGFQVTSSDVLANAEDDRTKGVFDASVRGNTDRFVLKLVKPAG